jgi:geranylgeranyl reductase family protein
MNLCDVAVVGAGPAGAWTACLLARRGARVVIIDPSHPREKPCGGGVTGRALSLLDQCVRERLPAVTIRQACFVDSRRHHSAAVPLDDGAAECPLIVASRAAFDLLVLDMARHAGARLLRARVSRIARQGSHWDLATSDGSRVTAGVLIGADGANSFTRRALARPFRREQLSIATGFFAHGVSAEDILIEFSADPPGYLWSFPRPGHLAIGVCAQATAATAASLRALASRWIDATGIARGARLEPYSWPIPSLAARDFTSLDIAGPGWMLVGDAAGLVDPITREGIFFALQSAGIAADAVSRAEGRPPDHVYHERIASEIAGELTRAARFKERFFQPRFVEVMLAALAESQPIRRVMADLIAGRQAYRGLAWRLARTLELGVASRAYAALRAR